MKKTLIAFALIACCAGTTWAQGLSGGIKVGANFANQKYKSDFGNLSPDARTSLHLGVYATMMFSETFGLQPELLYNSVGSKLDFSDLGGEEVVSKFNYLAIPVMLRYNPVPIFNIHAGPQFGFLLSAKQESGDDSEDVKDSFKGLDLGAGIGAGVDLPMGLGFSARYVFGLSNIYDGEDDAGELKNNTIQISATYKLFGK